MHQQFTTCRYCDGRMQPSFTPAGEACLSCLHCGHTDMNITLRPEPTPAPAPTLTASQRKALYYQHQGVTPVRSVNGWLVASATRSVVHFVDDAYRCSCEAGQADRGCWHAALVGLLDQKVAA